jgi:ABC-type multidrug transport system fused ATPase/permease subunit
MIVNTVTPHVANGVSIVIEAFRRCRDRGCTCNKKKTKQLLQEDYEEMNLGSEFLLEFRYSALLTTIFMIFMYSSGLPLLYFIAFLSFFFTYWFDKLFLLRCHRKPPAYTLHLSRKTAAIMRFCLIPHFFIGLYMYTNSTIITPTSIQSQLYQQYLNSDNPYLNSERFSNLHSAIFLATFAFFILLIVFRWTVFALIRRLTRACRKIKDRYMGNAETLSDNFYASLSPEILLKEFNKTVAERRELEAHINEQRQKSSPSKQDEAHFKEYSQKLVRKLKAIEEAFRFWFEDYGIQYKSSSHLKQAIRELLEKTSHAPPPLSSSS